MREYSGGKEREHAEQRLKQRCDKKIFLSLMLLYIFGLSVKCMSCFTDWTECQSVAESYEQV